MATLLDILSFLAIPIVLGIGLLSWSCCAAGGRADRDMGIDR